MANGGEKWSPCPMRTLGVRRALAGVVAVAVLAALVGVGFNVLNGTNAAAEWGPPTPLGLDVTASNGTGRITRPGRPCAADGDGAAWHYEYESALAPGSVGLPPGTLGLHLDVHSDLDSGAPRPSSWLQSGGSYATLSNSRGDVRLALDDGGSCTTRTATVDGTTAETTGTWVVDSASGAYEEALGSGTFAVTAGIAPGADNPLGLQLNGALQVLQPDLDFRVVKRFWGQLGADYALRIVSIVVEATNNGAGASFGTKLTEASTPTPGVTYLDGAPASFGDLAPGESARAVLRFRLELLQPCKTVILNCPLKVAVKADAPDVLDVSTTHTDLLATTAPDLPPPASK